MVERAAISPDSLGAEQTQAARQIVDKRIKDYEQRFGHHWPGFETAFAIMTMQVYIKTMMSVYKEGSTEDEKAFFSDLYTRDPAFTEFRDGFYNDVEGIVGSSMVGSVSNDKLNVMQLAQNGLNAWIVRERSPKMPTE